MSPTITPTIDPEVTAATDETSVADQLDQLKEQINEHHAKFEASVRTSLEHARDTGEALLDAKKAVGHGNFIGWVEENCSFSMRTAQKYMRIAQKWSELEPNAPPTAHLTIAKVLNLLAEPVGEDTDDENSDDERIDDAGTDEDSDDGDPDDEESSEEDTDGEEDDENSDDEDTDAEGTDDEETADEETDDKDTESEDVQATYEANLKKHNQYCARLQGLRDRGHLALKDKPVEIAVNNGMNDLVTKVRAVISEHSKTLCNKAIQNTGNDATFVAMVATDLLKERLDAVTLFAPKEPETNDK